MARQLSKLSATLVARMKKPGRYGDGGGLWLNISQSGRKTWVMRFRLAGKDREMGLGSADTVSLREARQAAQATRTQIARGIDPIAHRAAARASTVPTFGECAEQFIVAHAPQWKNPKHREQWTNSLATHAAALAETPVDQIGLEDVLAALKPIWLTQTETASRVRGRIERVLDFASTKGFRSAENPARWRGYLSNLLPKPGKIAKTKHHTALPYADLPAFWSDLGEREGYAAAALRLVILTATRTSEVRAADWSEIDLETRVWTIPADRMKAGKEHRVPLSTEAVTLLESLPSSAKKKGFVFPGAGKAKYLGEASMAALLKRMGRDITVHGFRSTFRDWAAEVAHAPREVAEAALAHTLGAVEAAYQRGDLLERRRVLMNQWAAHTTAQPTEKVVAIRG